MSRQSCSGALGVKGLQALGTLLAAGLVLGFAPQSRATSAPRSASAASVPAQAAAPPGWVRVAVTSTASFYLAEGTLRKEGAQVRQVIEMQDLEAADADGVRSRRFVGEYECRHRMHRIGKVESFEGPLLGGRRLFQVEQMGYWRKLPPGSPFARIHALVCADYTGPKE